MSSSKSSSKAKPKITQREVAEAANVSQSLVSLVLNGDGKEASEEIRERIHQAARDLDYTPLRRRNARKAKKLFAFIRPNVDRGHHSEEWIYDSYEQFYLDLQEQFRLKLQREGYSLISHDDKDPEATREWLLQWEVEGVFCNTVNEDLLLWISKRFPVVEVTRVGHRDVDCVNSDDYERIAISFDHLYEKGHRRIAYIRGRTQRGCEPYYLAYQNRCSYYKIEPQFIEIDEYEADLGDYARVFAGSTDRPTAFIADPIRLLIFQKHLIKQGIQIPEEVSLASIDNISACRFLEPSLVSIDLNFADLADNSLRLLLARIESPDRARCKVEVRPSLVAGGSVGSPSKFSASPKALTTL